jgi:hypothetical protein
VSLDAFTLDWQQKYAGRVPSSFNANYFRKAAILVSQFTYFCFF